MIQVGNKVMPSKGKTLVSIADDFCYGDYVFLGKVYYENGQLLEVPKDLTITDLKEVDLIEN